MREGDVLVVIRLDRLSRSTSDLLEIESGLQEKNVSLEVMERSINRATPDGKLLFTVVPTFAEFKHSVLVARTKKRLAAARVQAP
jgi:DNA invertase Pin-like site-specific DNA recombinase